MKKVFSFIIGVCAVAFMARDKVVEYYHNLTD